MAKLEEEKKGNNGINAILTIILLFAIGVMCFSGYRLYSIFSEYKRAGDEYDTIKRAYVTEVEPELEERPEVPVVAEHVQRKWSAPLTVDFERLKAINSDIVGWIYIEALPSISYPIVRGVDNDYYLHRTYAGEDNFAGTLFIDYENEGDFMDCNTILYGHNMKDGSMFGSLSSFRSPDTIARSPYVWILTPDGDYKYEVFSTYITGIYSDTYTLIKGPGDEMLQYLQTMAGYSEIDTGNHEFNVHDKCLTLSTCTGDSSTRYVVQCLKLEP